MKTPPAVVYPTPSILSELLGGWNRFWFNPADPTTLGLIRLCGGLVILYVHFLYTFDLQTLMGKDAWVSSETITLLREQAPVLVPPLTWPDPWQVPEPLSPDAPGDVKEYHARWGIDPRPLYAQGNPVWSIWYHVQDPMWMSVVHAGILVAIFLFTVGFCTRVTAVLTWIGVISYIQRAPTTLFGMDTMMNVMLIYLMIGPSGAALSVDRLLGRWWSRRQAHRRDRPPPPDLPPAPSASANFALRMMQVHFCIIYMASGLSKLQGGAWWNGTAVWGTMANASFNPLHLDLYYSLLVFLSRHRWLWEIVINGGTLFTVGLEISLPFLIWNRRLRWLMICCAVMLHAGIALIMGLMGFGLFMLCLLLSFVPGEVVRGVLGNLAEGGRHQLEALGLRPAASAVPVSARG